MLAELLLHQRRAQAHRARPVVVRRLDAARLHLLEADDEHAVGRAAPHQRARHVQARRARGAGVVRVVDRDARHAELVEDALAGGRVAEAVARHAQLDVVVRDLRVQHRLDAGLEAELRVGAQLARLDELRQADAEHEGVRLRALGSHDSRVFQVCRGSDS